MSGDSPEERVWDRGWDGHALAQLRRLARLPLPDKLDWLESAQRVVAHLAGARRDRPEPGGGEADR